MSDEPIEFRMSGAKLKEFCEHALQWFDDGGFTFGSILNVEDILDIASFPPSNGYMEATEFRDRELLKLTILTAFRDVLLEHRSRYAKQEGARLRILHPSEQIEYGEARHTRIAMQKLRRGQRIVSFTETDDIGAKNAAMDRLKNVEALIRRQQEPRRGI